MKTNFFTIAILMSLAFSIQSCKKHEQGKVSYQTIEVNLDANKSYQYDFGVGKHDLSITKQSQEFLVSEIDNADNVNVFNYTPKANFAGSDEIQVTLYGEEEHHHHGKGGHHPNGNCQHQQNNNQVCHKHDDDDDKTIYIFKLNIQKVISTTKTAVVEIEK
jgi:hypothetical protein